MPYGPRCMDRSLGFVMLPFTPASKLSLLLEKIDETEVRGTLPSKANFIGS